MNNKRLLLSHSIAELFDTKLPYFIGARQLRNFLTQLLSPSMTPPQRISTRYGFDMMLTTSYDAIDNDLYTMGTYEAGTLNIINNCLNEGDIFVDVGANIGLMSLLASSLVGESGAVYSFEPVTTTFNLLNKNITLNQIDNIQTMNFGLGSAPGTALIFEVDHENRGMSSFVERKVNNDKGTEVSINTLDSFLVSKEVENVRLLKIDVEGWELEVLKGAQELIRKPEAPIICIEYNKQFPEHKAIYELIISSNKYHIYILPHGNWHTSRLIRIRNLDDLPTINNFNIYCFLPIHKESIPASLFANR